MSSSWILLGLLLIGVTRAQENRCVGAAVEDPKGTEVKWTYEPSKDECRKIIRKDSKDGVNVFSTEKECLSVCSEVYNRLYPPGEAVCDLPRDPGRCMSLIFMWYYDNEKKACDSFFYGGCEGNGNRFDNKTECINLCVAPKKGKSGASGAALDVEPTGSGTDAGLIIGVIFGVIFGVAFLVTLGMYLVQRKKLKKQKHQRVPDTEMK